MDARQQLLSSARLRGWEPLVWLLAFVMPFAFPGHALIVNEVAIVALFAVSLDLVLGYTGIVSLGHAAFLGLGAYASALFAKHVMPDPLVGLLFGMACATLLGAACSLTILRGTDLTRLMVTLGMALILMELANKLDWLTGGADGLSGVTVAPILGLFKFDLFGRTAFIYCLIALFNHSAQKIEATLRASIDPKRDWSSQIDLTIRLYLETLAANPLLLRALFVEILALGPAGLVARRLAMERLAGVLLAAAANHRSTPIPQWLATGLIGGINEMVLQHIERGSTQGVWVRNIMSSTQSVAGQPVAASEPRPMHQGLPPSAAIFLVRSCSSSMDLGTL